jgi:hypothetical protein
MCAGLCQPASPTPKKTDPCPVPARNYTATATPDQ